jgi:TolA protein
MITNRSNDNLLHPKFPFYLRRSFYIHLGLLSLTLISGKVILEQRKILQQKNIELIEASVRVDMVAMPKYTLNELKNISSGVEEVQKENAAAEKVKEEVKTVEEKEELKPDVKSNELAFEEANKKKRKDFLGKLKEIGNKKIKSDGNQKAEKGLGGEKVSALKDLVLAGNKLNTGTAIFGSGNTAEMTAFQVYVAKLPDRVRPHWRLPTFLMNKNLKCRVRVWLDLEGNVTHAEVYQGSGDNEYDQRAMEAVRSASPFPKISDEFGKRAKNGDIVLGFPL